MVDFIDSYLNDKMTFNKIIKKDFTDHNSQNLTNRIQNKVRFVLLLLVPIMLIFRWNIFSAQERYFLYTKQNNINPFILIFILLSGWIFVDFKKIIRFKSISLHDKYMSLD